jgi:hypothetical protein
MHARYAIREVQMSATIDGDYVVTSSGERLGLDDLAPLAEELPWVAPDLIVMPPHEYVVEGKLQTERELETFGALRVASSSHPRSWKAFFRAYRSRNSYLVVGQHRYWYTQIGPARMMNRCDADSELENTRGAEGDKAVTKWTGTPYAWRREFGLLCENLPLYCNLVAVEVDGDKTISIVRYAAMVPRDAVSEWEKRRGEPRGEHPDIERMVKEQLDGIGSIDGMRESRSTRSECSEEEASIGAVWMRLRDMAPERVATHLRLFSTAPRLEVERVVPLSIGETYLVQLTVPAVRN